MVLSCAKDFSQERASITDVLPDGILAALKDVQNQVKGVTQDVVNFASGPMDSKTITSRTKVALEPVETLYDYVEVVASDGSETVRSAKFTLKARRQKVQQRIANAQKKAMEE